MFAVHRQPVRDLVADGQKERGAAEGHRLLMPVVIGIFMFMYKWPAGLFIYWVTSNLWTIAQQFAAEKIMPVPVAGGGDF